MLLTVAPLHREERRMDKRIDEIQQDDGEYFVYLKKGWKLHLGTPADFQHCFGARTKTDIKKQMKCIESCRCNTCA